MSFMNIYLSSKEDIFQFYFCLECAYLGWEQFKGIPGFDWINSEVLIILSVNLYIYIYIFIYKIYKYIFIYSE